MINIANQKTLITGASGYLGKQLIFELGKKGIKPVVQLRQTSNATYIDKMELEKRYADLQNRDELGKLVEGIDNIIHTAAWVNFRKDRLTQFTGINTIAAVNLFREAQKAGVKKFVHISTVATVGAIRRKGEFQPVRGMLDEEAKYNLNKFSIPYFTTKRAAETELIKLAGEGDTELIIVNPSIMIAPSRTGDDRGKVMKTFSKLIMPEFSIRINLVDIRDVAPGVIAALEKGRPGERYILAGDNVSVRDLVLMVSGILGKMPHLVRPPKKFLDFLARSSEFFRKLFGKSKISFYPDIVHLLNYDWAYSSRKARDELGYKTRSLYTSLNDLLSNNFTGTYLKPEEPEQG